MRCKICNILSNFVFQKKILKKYDISFFRCSNCGFLQTEKPYWLEEAYVPPLSPLDTGLVSRPLYLSQITENIIFNYFEPKGRFLDYGGGSGIFTRMMRDRGLQFYRQDKYAENIFAQYFDIFDLPENDRSFELLTCFEVLEHIENPIDTLSQIFLLSSSFLCSTVLQPPISIEELQSWWYLGELHGQHISFYTQESMRIIADKFGCNYYSNGIDLHLFTPKKIGNFIIQKQDDYSWKYRLRNKLIVLIDKVFCKNKNRYSLQSLTFKDAEWITEKLQQ